MGATPVRTQRIAARRIRRLNRDDAQVTWDLRRVALETEPQAFGSSATEHARTTALEYWGRISADDPDTRVLGAFEGAELLGMVRLTRESTLKRRHLAWVESMFVRTEFRGQGIGRALMARVVEEAGRMRGVVSLFLTVAQGQKAARQLYVAAGFRSTGVEPRGLKVDGRFIDEEFLVLVLDDKGTA